MRSIETNKILINRTPIQNKSNFSNSNYVSPADILPVPKALPQKRFAQQKDKKISCYYFNTKKRTPCRKFSSFGQETIKKMWTGWK